MREMDKEGIGDRVEEGRQGKVKEKDEKEETQMKQTACGRMVKENEGKE